MEKVIKRIDPLQLGKILAIFLGLYSIIPASVIILGHVFEANIKIRLILLSILSPLVYGILGFVGGIIVAALYNWCIKWVGGIKITLEDEGGGK
ncbi:MAG: hypothetical protein JW806_02300 [Sedimentisphaerales bacterium]|nr:hypothetical protein [Sedimentisphaerales bacterium]